MGYSTLLARGRQALSRADRTEYSCLTGLTIWEPPGLEKQRDHLVNKKTTTVVDEVIQADVSKIICEHNKIVNKITMCMCLCLHCLSTHISRSGLFHQILYKKKVFLFEYQICY